MLVRLVLILHRVALLAALSIALVGTGFAHRIAVAEEQALAFALANGVSPADFCGDAPMGRLHSGGDCQACQIAGTGDLPPLTGARIDLELAFRAGITVPRDLRVIPRVADPAHPPQGPPVA